MHGIRGILAATSVTAREFRAGATLARALHKIGGGGGKGVETIGIPDGSRQW